MPGPNEEGPERVASSDDIVDLRSRIRSFADALGFRLADVTRIVTAASELMRNMAQHAGEGEARWRRIEGGGRLGIELVFEDRGPGIHSVEDAMEPGMSTGRGLGMGLPGAERLMDEMEIETEPGRRTRVTVRKWLPDVRF